MKRKLKNKSTKSAVKAAQNITSKKVDPFNQKGSKPKASKKK